MEREIFETLAGYEDSKLRPYQLETKRNIYHSFKDDRSVLLQMPTGTGKTHLFVSILSDLRRYIFREETTVRKPIRSLVLVHHEELLDQVNNTLDRQYGLGCGIIHSGERMHKEKLIQIASVQTMSRRLDVLKDLAFDFIIVDEAHHVPAKSYMNILNAYPNAFVLGVTATPFRLKEGEGFSEIFNKLIVSQSVNEFIRAGYLAKYKYYSVASYSHIQQMIDSIRKFNIAGDYDESELMNVCNTDGIRAQIVDTYEKYAKGKKGIVYTINQLHNIRLCENFKARGYNVAAIDSKTPAEERRRIVDDFRKGKIDIIFNVNIFSEGFDCPDIEFIQLARPTKSLAMYLQQVGRGLRIAQNKAECIFLDNVGSYNKFGFPSTPHNWKLYFEGGSVEEENHSKRKFNIDGKSDSRSLAEGYEKVHLIDVEDGQEPNNFENKTTFILDLLLKFWDDYTSYIDIVTGFDIKDNTVLWNIVSLMNCKPKYDWKLKEQNRLSKIITEKTFFGSLTYHCQLDFRNYGSGRYNGAGYDESYDITSFGTKYVAPILKHKISGTELFNVRKILSLFVDEELYHEVQVAVELGEEDISVYDDLLFKWLVQIYSIVPQSVDGVYDINLPVNLLDYYMDLFSSFDGLYNVKRISTPYYKKKADPEAGLLTEDTII